MVTRKGPSWGLAEAKAQLSEVVLRAQEQPQIIQRRGKAIGVIVGAELHAEAQRLAMLGSAERRMKSFLDAAAQVRAQGGVDLPVPARQPRRSPFASR